MIRSDIENNLIETNDPTLYPRLHIKNWKTFCQSFCICIFLFTIMSLCILLQSSVILLEENSSSSN